MLVNNISINDTGHIETTTSTSHVLHTYILVAISIVIWLLATYGNVKLLQYANSKLKKQKTISISNTIFVNLTRCNVLSCCIAIPCHICKLIIDSIGSTDATPYVCLGRYISTMVTIDLSLVTLTAMIVDRRDKILLEPYGLQPKINNKNFSKYTICILAFVIILNSCMFAVYLYLFLESSILPCHKHKNKSTIHTVLSVIESTKTAIIVVPSIVIMIRSISQLYKKVKENSENSRRMQRALRKIRQSFYYAVSFLTFWIPFGIMALSSGTIPKDIYEFWFNIGYTVSYGYLVALPVVCAITDVNFNPRKQLQSRSGSESTVCESTERKSRLSAMAITNITIWRAEK